jgi:lipoprotein NlpD
MISFVNFRGILAPAFASPLAFMTARLALVSIAFILASCAASRSAPVSDARPPAGKPETAAPAANPADSAAAAEAAKPADSPRVHVVQRSETLYSIAFQNGLDVRELAAWNNIVNPAVIRVGDTLRLSAPPSATAASAQPQPGQPVASPLVYTSANAPLPEGSPLTNSAQMKIEPKAGRVPYSDAAYAKLSGDAGAGINGAAPAVALPSASATAKPGGNGDSIAWSWPVKGKVLSAFTEASKGIDIAGSRGAPVFAAAAGKVIHSSSVIRGYGRLIIIKHSDTWLSAYAYNEKLLVNEGQEISKGQKIAEMGSSDTDAVKLHFEIRSKGKPVDPLKFLPPQ